MTIAELKELIADKPDDMEVVIGIGDSLEDICLLSKPLFVKEPDGSKGEKIMVLDVCFCDDDFDDEDIFEEIDKGEFEKEMLLGDINAKFKKN